MSSTRMMVLKICLVGSWGVGKTSLRRTYMGNRLKRNYQPTIGADFSLKSIEVDDNNYQLLIWDIAGEEKFDKVRDVYFQGAFGALLVFDLTRRESFDDVINWVDTIESSTETRGIPLVILGNKKDLTPHEMNQCATNDEINDLINELSDRYHGQFNITYIETSTFSKLNVEKSFIELVRQIKRWIPIRNRRLHLSSK